MNLTLSELVELISGKLLHAGNVDRISGMNALNEAEPNDVSFLGNEKYYQDYLNTRAGVVLVPANVPEQPSPAIDTALVEVDNPSFAFGLVVKHFAQQARMFTPGVHPGAHVAENAVFDPEQVSIKPGAVIESGVHIGNGTEVGAGAYIGHNATIGSDCLLHANATVREECVLGDRVILQPGCVIGSDGYGYEMIDGKHVKVDQVGIVVIGDDVEIGANSTVDRARFGKTVIGEGTKVDNLVQVAHNVTVGKHCLLVAQAGIAGSSHLGDYVTMAAKTGCVGHVKIGDKAVLTAKAAALKNLEGGKIYSGFPARPMMEYKKKQAHISRLPKIAAEIKELKRRLDESSGS